MSGHVAVVLAAGGSRRLGRPKQLLARDGEALVHRAARLAIATAPLRTLVVLGAAREALAPLLADLACDIAINADWPSGLAGSLRVAHAALRGHDGPVLLVACDQPGLRAAHLEALVRGAAAADARCAATWHEDGAGVPVVVPAEMLSDGEDLAGDRGIGGRIRRLPGDAIFLLQAPELRHDLDTEADVALAIEHGWIDASNVRTGEA